MAKAHGKKAKFKVKDSGGELRDISTYLTSAGVSKDVDLPDTSGLGTDDKESVPGLKGATIPIEGSYDPTVDGYLDGLLGKEGGTEVQYFPQGEGEGKVVVKGTAHLGSYSATTDLGGAGKISGSFTFTGAPTREVL